MFEEFADLAGLPLELFFVGKVLILAASAGAEVRAMGLDAIGRGFDDFDEVGVRAIGLISPDLGADFFARQGEGDEDDPAIRFCNTGSEVGESFDLEIDDLVPFVGFRFEFAGAFLGHDKN